MRGAAVDEDRRVPKILLRAFAVLLGVAVVAVCSVVAVDTWRGAGVHPEPCRLLAAPHGELLDDSGVLARAWAALTDPGAETLGDLDGSAFVLERSCVLYAGRFGGVGDPHVVVAETTVTGYRALVRIGELRVRGGDRATLRATSGSTDLLGAALKRGVVLPLSGYYLAGDVDVTGVRVRTARDGFATAVPAGDLGSGVFNLGAVADYTLAPAEQGEHVTAVVEVERTGGLQPLTAVVPVLRPLMVGRPHRPVIAIELGNAAPDAVAPVFPVLTADPRFLHAFDRSVLPTAMEVRTATIPGGSRVEVTLRNPSEVPEAPFVFAVRDGVARPEDRG